MQPTRTPTTCPYCGNTNHFAEGQTAYTCISCGLLVQLTDFQAEARKLESAVLDKLDTLAAEQRAEKLRQLNSLFWQATGLQRNRRFTEAAQLYRQLLVQEGDDPEIYWRILMCHYCVEYQEGESGGHVPFILYPDLTPCSEQAEYSYLFSCVKTKEQSLYYREKLDKIESILSNYRQLRQSMKHDYDVFISVKQSNPSGGYTADSDKASDLFDFLTGKGLRVFNSRRTRIPAGQEYEPYIIAALLSARVMIVVGSSADHMNARWVKNEWSRFQWLQLQEKQPRLLFCYLVGGMEASSIPRELNPNKQAITDGVFANDKLTETLRPIFRQLADPSQPQTGEPQGGAIPTPILPEKDQPDGRKTVKPLKYAFIGFAAAILVFLAAMLMQQNSSGLPGDSATIPHNAVQAADSTSSLPTGAPTHTPAPTSTSTPTPTPTPIPTAVPYPHAYGEYTALTDTVGLVDADSGNKQNLFITPNRDHDPIKKIPNGSIVLIHGKLDNGWYYVQYDGTDGYMIQKNVQLVQKNTPTPKPTATPKPTKKPTTKPTATPKPITTPKPKVQSPPAGQSYKANASSSYKAKYNTEYSVTAAMAVDGNLTTAWNEGAKGSGVGEWIQLQPSNDKKYSYQGFKIANGFQYHNYRKGDRWSKNNRVAQLSVYADGEYVGSYEIHDLYDGYQTIYFDEPVSCKKLRFVIDSVWGGSEFSEACISEIKPF